MSYLGRTVPVASIASTQEGRALLEANNVEDQRSLLSVDSTAEADAKLAEKVDLTDENYYQKSNILGTVSAIGDYPNLVPTGAIIESGSNANGTYVKYADGTMLCSRYHITLGNIGTVGSWNIYEWSYPSSFTALTAVFLQLGAAGPNEQVFSDVFVKNGGSTPTTSVDSAIIYYYLVADSVYGGRLSFIAIGRWK